MEFKSNKSFIKENFLLENKTAEQLYFDYAESMPIIDYHNHLPPDVIANNKPFDGINEIWLSKKTNKLKNEFKKIFGFYVKNYLNNLVKYLN